MRRITILCLILVAFIAVSSMATAADPSWIVRGSYVKTWPSTDSCQTESVIGDNPLLNELSLDSGQGFGFDLEYKMSPKLGIVLLGVFTDMEGTFVAGLEPGEESELVTDNNNGGRLHRQLRNEDLQRAAAALIARRSHAGGGVRTRARGLLGDGGCTSVSRAGDEPEGCPKRPFGDGSCDEQRMRG